ncbi:MAG: agmatinase [Candidatus Rokubacteria bacterium]|nr:agmatinase [Candidatus Rokubacteria bacterium]
MRPVSPRFIACTRSPDEAQIVFFGLPFEGTVNLRKGADRGPLDLRLASDSIETYSPALGRDLEDLAMADLGDCDLPDGSPRAQLEAAREEIRRFWRPGLRPVMLGGDHTATLPVIEVLAARSPDLRVLQFDAHPDTREEFLGERFCYASAMARVMEVVPPERVFQVGMRTGSREEFERKHPNFCPVTAVAPADAVRKILPELRRHPVYVTMDIDVLDPSEAPGTGSPEPGGLRVPELVELVRLLQGCEVVGTDLVEVAHAHDPSGRTGIAGSWILREAILTWWGK